MHGHKTKSDGSGLGFKSLFNQLFSSRNPDLFAALGVIYYDVICDADSSFCIAK